MEATLTGRNGLHVVAPVDKASKNESDCAATQNQPTVDDHAAVPMLTLGNVKLDSVQVRIMVCFTTQTSWAEDIFYSIEGMDEIHH